MDVILLPEEAVIAGGEEVLPFREPETGKIIFLREDRVRWLRLQGQTEAVERDLHGIYSRTLIPPIRMPEDLNSAFSLALARLNRTHKAIHQEARTHLIAQRPETETRRPTHRIPEAVRSDCYEALRPREMMFLYGLGFARELQESRKLIELNDDWDERGSKGFSEATLNRTINFIAHLAGLLRDKTPIAPSSLSIMPGSNGNIDFELLVGRKRLLMSIPEERQAVARYFAHNGDKSDVTKGTLHPESNVDWLAQWLAI